MGKIHPHCFLYRISNIKITSNNEGDYYEKIQIGFTILHWFFIS